MMKRKPLVGLTLVATGMSVVLSTLAAAAAIAPSSQAGVQSLAALTFYQPADLRPDAIDKPDPDDALALENLGIAHSVRGEYLLAIPLLRRACALRGEQRHDDAELVNCLEVLATALIYTSQFTEAESVLKRAQARQEGNMRATPLSISRTLGVVAQLQRGMVQYYNSSATLDRALSLRNGSHTDSDDRVMLALLRGDLLWLTGDIRGAHRQYETAVALPHSSSRESLDHLVALRRLAIAEDYIGHPYQSAALANQAGQAGEVLLAECHDERGALLNDRAVIARNQGDYFAARDLYQRALAHKTRCASVNGADVVTPLFNLAAVAEAMGDAAEADKLYARAVQAWSSRYRAGHPFVALAVDGLARVSLMQGSLYQARQRWLRALNIRRRSLGEDHPDVAWSLTNLAQTEILLNNIPSAAMSLERSAQIYQKAGVSDQPDRFVQFLSAQAELQLRVANPSGAHDILAQALASRLQIFGAAHPLSAQARADLARVQALAGREDLALHSALMAEDVAKDHLRRSISFLPERQALMYAGVRPEGLNLAASIAAAGHESRRDVFDAVIRSRAVVLDELAARSQFKSASDPNVNALRERLIAARQRLANLSLRSVRERVPTPAAILEEAQKDAEAAERALAERSAAFRLEQARAESGFDEVWRALPADSVLISYLKYQHTALPKSGQSLKVVPPTESYVAFVATARDGAVAAVPLGPTRSVDAMIADWRIAISAQARPNEVEYRKVAGALRRQLWDPIAEFVKGASLVFVVPDGAINLVSFGALPVGNNYLLETVQGLHYLSAERDLLSPNSASNGGGLLAIGGVDFVSQPSPARGSAPAAASRIATSRSASSSCSDALARFEALPGTNGEVADISAVWKSTGDGGAVVLSGRSATEQAFKREASGRSILHLATHGFFFDGGCVPASSSGTRAVGGLVSAKPAVSAPTPAVERQFTLSGLALAGANLRADMKPDAEDGILTAEEVVSLNLDGVEWAVLSACDTGLGRIRAGEGVFGLRRAFQIAGVRTVIMSLWAVEDEATRLWMRSLYEGRLARRLSTSRAVRDASIAVLADRRAKGLSAHPFYWAGFVAAGGWQ